jgi:hypothetical protein
MLASMLASWNLSDLHIVLADAPSGKLLHP